MKPEDIRTNTLEELSVIVKRYPPFSVMVLHEKGIVSRPRAGVLIHFYGRVLCIAS